MAFFSFLKEKKCFYSKKKMNRLLWRQISELCCKQHILHNLHHSDASAGALAPVRARTLALAQKSLLLEIWPCTKVSELRGVLLTPGEGRTPGEKKRHKFPSRSKSRFRISCQPFDMLTYPDLESSRRASNLVVTPSQEQNRVNRSSKTVRERKHQHRRS